VPLHGPLHTAEVVLLILGVEALVVGSPLVLECSAPETTQLATGEVSTCEEADTDKACDSAASRVLEDESEVGGSLEAWTGKR
jgi:hypothetical protein